MIVQKDFLGKLKDFGINSYEAKLWTALLSRGVATAGELSDIANVPRSRSYDVLESLERKGFVVMKLGKPIKYIAVPPQEVLERVKKNISEEAEKQVQLLERIKDSEVLSELNSLFKHGIETVNPADLTGAVKGRANIISHLSSMIKNAEKSVSLITTEQGLVRKFELLKGVIAKAKERGVRVRILAPITKVSQPAARHLSQHASVRHCDALKARFCVVDGKNVSLMSLDDASLHPNADFGIWVGTEFLAGAFENVFELLWQQAKPVK